MAAPIPSQDNIGFRTTPSPNCAQPVLTQTAQRLTNAAADTNATITVEGGKRYRFSCLVVGGFYFGLADVTTAANVRWACPLGTTMEIQVPEGVTTLHYATTINDGIGYLVEIHQNSVEEYKV
jgi:hypothetical protein